MVPMTGTTVDLMVYRCPIKIVIFMITCFLSHCRAVDATTAMLHSADVDSRTTSIYNLQRSMKVVLQQSGRQGVYLLGFVVPHNAHVRQHLSLQDFPSVLNTLLPGHTYCCTTLANVVQSHLQPAASTSNYAGLADT